MDSITVFADIFSDFVSGGVEKILLESIPKDENNSLVDWNSNDEKKTSCAYCRIKFEDLVSQREHYKLDWHRYNLKQSLVGKTPITEEQFNDRNVNDDLSSISGSDSEVEDTLDSYATAQGKFFLQTKNKRVICIYKCLLFNRKEQNLDDNALINRRLNECCLHNRQWTILMLGGGHFAGAVFKGGDVLAHKTFHCYTVRAGQGGSQSSKDNKSGGSHPKSAGASLRRYNELSYAQHIRDIIEKWDTEINESSRIFYRAAGPSNRSVLFGGQKPIIDRNNEKLRIIPFSTRRATFTEVKRVHAVLSTVEVYDFLEKAMEKYSFSKPDGEPRRNKAKTSSINRAKSRESQQRPLDSLPESPSSSEDESNKIEFNLSTDNVELTFDLEEFGDSLTPEQRKRAPRKRKPKKSKSKKAKEKEEASKKETINILIKGDLLALKKKLDIIIEKSDNPEQDKKLFINQTLDDHMNTLLHFAALNEHCEVIIFLLENDADPCAKDLQQKTPYSCTQSKKIREAFRQFAKDNPEKYNYSKAQIPTNALTKEELETKKKVQKALRKERENEKRQENKIKMKELEEKETFLKLSDREKRALAAERRILNQCGAVTVRCFLCGLDIAGKVPFEYMGYTFCTTDCLKTHRLQNPLKLS